MSDRARGSGPRRRDRDELRRTMEQAVKACRAAGGERRYAAGGQPGAAEALAGLAEARLPRMVKLRIMLDGVRRGSLDPGDPAVTRVLEEALPQGLDRRARRLRVEACGRQLAAMAGGGRLLGEDWEEWTARTGRQFDFTTQEQTFRTACNDEEEVVKATPDGRLVRSRLIEAEFWSDQPPAAFARYVNPVNWPDCSSAWRGMRVLQGSPRERGGYDCVLEEDVVINEVELRVPLEVGYRERADGSRVWVRFNLSRPFYQQRAATKDPVPVDVDTGTVSASSVTGGRARTLVRATKYLHMVDDDAMVPELACDVGWPELMVAMAENCGAGWPAAEAGEDEPGAADGAADVDAAVRRFAERVAAECRNGIDETRPHVQRLIGRFTGPSWDARWINDLLDIGLVTARRYGRVTSRVRGLANELRAADPKGRP
jgi:hypothetical protein